MADMLGIKGGYKLIMIGQGELLIGGDVMLEAADIMITPDTSSLKAIRSKLEEMETGELLTVKVLRGGEIKVLSTRLP